MALLLLLLLPEDKAPYSGCHSQVPYASYTITVNNVCPDVTLFCTADNKEAIYSRTKMTNKTYFMQDGPVKFSLTACSFCAVGGGNRNSDYQPYQPTGDSDLCGVGRDYTF